MRRPGFIRLLIFSMVTATAAELPAQSLTPESIARQKFNQVFVKVIMPGTARTPKQDGPVVESWAAEQLKQSGESKYFAVTDWVPVCDLLLADDIVDNFVWDGRVDGKHYCPVSGDIPERENGRVLVRVAGWLPYPCEASIKLSDELGNRAVAPVQVLGHEEKKPGKTKEKLPYVAVIIAPPPLTSSRHPAMPKRQNKAVNAKGQ